MQCLPECKHPANRVFSANKKRQNLKGTLFNVAQAFIEQHEKQSVTVLPTNLHKLLLSVGCAHFDMALAELYFQEALASQRADGMILQQTGETTDVAAFPLHGALLWYLYSVSKNKSQSKHFLAKLYPSVLSWHAYLFLQRDAQEVALPAIFHPAESLIEPLDEQALPMQEPLFLAALAWSNEGLIKIGHLLKVDILEVIQWHELSIFSMNNKLWNKEQGAYEAFSTRIGASKRLCSLAGVMPMIGEVPTQDQAEQILQKLEATFLTNQEESFILFPSCAGESQASILVNWLLYRGLKRYDFDTLAGLLRRNMLQLFKVHGFYGHFDAQRGEPTHPHSCCDPAIAAIALDLLKGK